MFLQEHYVPRKKKFRDRIVKRFQMNSSKVKTAFGLEEWGFNYMHAFGKEDFIIISSLEEIENAEETTKEFLIETAKKYGVEIPEQEEDEEKEVM